jgi:hypothetical protein
LRYQPRAPIFKDRENLTQEEGPCPMSTLLNIIQDSLRKRAAYARTVAEIEAMPLEVAIDLDIYKPDAAKIAAKAVYGR